MNTSGRDILGKRIAPGFWVDADGHPHISVKEILELFEFEDTPANRQMVTEMVERILGDKNAMSVLHRADTKQTYAIINDHEAIHCFRCNRTSYNPNDVEKRYCGFCHAFHEP